MYTRDDSSAVVPAAVNPAKFNSENAASIDVLASCCSSCSYDEQYHNGVRSETFCTSGILLFSISPVKFDSGRIAREELLC